VTAARNRAADGAIDPGRGLTEQFLATEHEVSRPTARSAITYLVAEGLLRRDTHKPADVPVLSEADVRDLFLVRTPLEREVVRLLAGRPFAPEDAAKAVDDLAAIGPERPHSAFVEADPGFPPRAGRRRRQPRLPGVERGDPPVDGPVTARVGP
jgi:DNA-binding GntR family transcriptional regulator